MEDQKTSIFRKQSLDRVSSPEELDQYLMVTGPGVWITLIAIIVLLIGVLSWMVLGHLDTTVGVAVISEDRQAVCYVPKDKADVVIKSGKIKISETEYTLHDAGYSPMVVTADTDVNILLAGGLEVGAVVQPLRIDAQIPDGTYTGKVVVETINPIKFIIN